MMNEQQNFYLCPTCFEASAAKTGTHQHAMIEIDPQLLTLAQRQPPIDSSGRLQSRAPRWFLQATVHARRDGLRQMKQI